MSDPARTSVDIAEDDLVYGLTGFRPLHLTNEDEVRTLNDGDLRNVRQALVFALTAVEEAMDARGAFTRYTPPAGAR